MKIKLPIFKITVISTLLGAFLTLVPSAFASTLTLSPGSVATTPGQTFTVTVRLNAGSDNVNAVAAYLNYPSNLFEATSIRDSSSAFSIKAAAEFGSGSVKISRGNFSGVSGNLLVATVTFKAKSLGKGSISFVGGSKAPRTSDHSDSLDLSKSGGALVNVLASLPQASASPAGQKPEISGLDFTNIASNSATVVWKTNQPTDSLVEFGSDGVNYFGSSSNTKLVADHSIVLTSPLFSAGQIFHIRVTSKDANENSAISDDKVLHFKGAAVKVKVTDINNVPVNNAQIYLFSDPLQTFTNQNGDAYYNDILPGKHTLLVKFGDYEKSNDIVVANSTNVQSFGIKMSISIAQASNQGLDRTKVLTIIGAILVLILIIIVIWVVKKKRSSGGLKAINSTTKPTSSPKDSTASPENPVIYK